MPQRAIAALLLVCVLVTAAVPGCSGRHRTETDKDLTLVYAELMLLNEQEKIVRPVADSVYRQHAADVLKKNGISEADFKNRSAVLMEDGRAWRDFLGGVSLVFDSLKTVRPQRPK